MNKQMKLLALRAGFNEMGIWNINGIEEYHQRFAELIVLECVDICKGERSKYNKLRQSADNQADFNMYAEGGAVCDSIHMQIRKLFGVNRV